MTTEVQLAKGVVAMLNDQGVSPAAELAFAPVLERGDFTGELILVAPGGLTSQVIDRSGRRQFERGVDVAVVGSCKPTDADRIQTLLDLCGVVGELLARQKPLDDALEPMPVRCLAVDQEPLYDAERLRGGTFLAVLSARYAP